MNKTITINMMGKSYQINSPEEEIHSLEQAARFLEEKMQSIRSSGKIISLDSIAVIAALNIAHQFLTLENQTQADAHSIQQRLRDLQHKVDNALATQAQLEFSSAE